MLEANLTQEISAIESGRIRAIKKFLLKLQDDHAALAWLGNVGGIRDEDGKKDMVKADEALIETIIKACGKKSFVGENGIPLYDVALVLKIALMPKVREELGGKPRLFIATQPEKIPVKEWAQKSGLVDKRTALVKKTVGNVSR